MTASDLPETYANASDMARALASYIADPLTVRRYVMERFHRAPRIHTIRQFRAEHLRKPALEQPFKPHEGYWPGEVSDRMAKRNAAFVQSLRATYPERFRA